MEEAIFDLSSGYDNVLKPETVIRLQAIQSALREGSVMAEYHLDESDNRLDITIRDYVFDSFVCNLRLVLNLADFF